MAISQKLIAGALTLSGLLAIVVGVSLIYVPAGLICAGIAAAAVGYLLVPVGEDS